MDWLFDQPFTFGVTLAVMLCVALELGFRVSVHFQLLEDSNRKEQLSAARDGLFILLSLLLGFTVALAGARFAERRSLMVKEAVSIDTSDLRAATIPQPISKPITKPVPRLLELSAGTPGCADGLGSLQCG